jgi:nitrous oxide reductase
MSRNEGTAKTSRRAFLRDAAAVGGIAAVAAGSGAAAAQVSAAAPARSEARPKGYRVTPHVAKYYEKARI